MMINPYIPKTPVYTKKRIGVFGGAFNPIHYGHISLAKEVKKYVEYDTFMFVPTFQAAHKDIECDFDHRCKMVSLCIDSYSGNVMSPLEKFLGKPTITINLIMAIVLSQTESVNIDLIIGFDQFEDFKLWDEWEVILNHCRLVVVNRGESGIYQRVEVEKICNSLYPLNFKEFIVEKDGNWIYGEEKVLILNNPDIDIPEMSSTQVRAMIKNEKPLSQFVIPQVRDYIETNKLYR